MKKRILIYAAGSEHWIGGLYYKRNIAFMLSTNQKIVDNFDIIIITSRIYKNVFDNISNNIKVICYNESGGRTDKFQKFYALLRSKADYVFPMDKKPLYGIKTISWIADFQHKHFPQFFSTIELENRERRILSIKESDSPLVLSSFDALDDFHNYYGYEKRDIYVVPFVSYIEPEILCHSRETEDRVLTKYGLKQLKYACVMNQFWQHKNHTVVFHAIKLLLEMNPDLDFYFVFTGKLEDHRNDEYIDIIKRLLRDNEISSHIIMLGYIDREEQIIIMKNSEFVIKPSLFEGWGTVVEDSKVLDKTILLSDIPIHHEQKNEKCILFNPYDPSLLARLIEKECNKEHIDDVDKGIADMHTRAKHYSKGFEKLLFDLEHQG